MLATIEPTSRSADGDDTYDAASAPLLIRTLRCGPYDVVNAARTNNQPGIQAGSPVSAIGSSRAPAACFWRDVVGHAFRLQVMSRRFVENVPRCFQGLRDFETEP